MVEELRSMKLKEAAKKVEDGIEETLTYCDFPSEHWTRIRTNNVIERLNREIRRRTRVVGSFPDGNSALMLVCARLRHVAGTQWGCQVFFAKWFAGSGMSEVSHQWRRPQGQPPGASCSCTSCGPTGCRPHGAAEHRPA